MKNRGSRVMDGSPMMLRAVPVLLLTLVARMRVLWRVVDIVVCSDSVVARQRVSATWVPPERAALAGSRILYGNNLTDWSPVGLPRLRGKSVCCSVGVLDASLSTVLWLRRCCKIVLSTCIGGVNSGGGCRRQVW